MTTWTEQQREQIRAESEAATRRDLPTLIARAMRAAKKKVQEPS